MRLYVEVARATFRQMTTYRGATFGGIVTNTVFGFILAYVMLAVFRERPVIGGFDAVDAVTFTFVGQGLLMVVGIFGRTDQGIRIRTGEVAIDLSRPYDYQAWWAAVAYGRSVFYAIFRGIPPFVVGALVLPTRLPDHAGTWIAFLCSVAVAVGVAFAYGFIIELTAFWLIEIRGLRQGAWLIAQFLSGTYIPLVLLPDWVEPAVRALPYAAMVQLPIEVFLGKHTGMDLLAVYARQVVWAAVLITCGRLVLARAVRKVVVQGG
jgi:ABC-2 type transport system permease protein